MKRFIWSTLLIVAFLFLSACTGSEDRNDGNTDSDATDGDSVDGDQIDSDQIDGDQIDDDQIDDDQTDGDSVEAKEEWELPYASAEGSGNYNVGAKTVRFVNTEQERDIPGMIWYPTNDTDGEKITYQEIFQSETAIENAMMAEGGPFPVIVFSHGSTSFAEQSFYQTEFFASHGFIVAACNHVGNTSASNDETIMVYMMQQRPRDVSMMIDHLERVNSSESDPFFAKVDLDKIGAIGHSFGGFTVTYLAGAIFQFDRLLEFCGYGRKKIQPFFCTKLGEDNIHQFDREAIIEDDRIKAIIPQAPVAYQAFWDEGIKEIDIPVLMQIGELDETLDPYAEMYPAYDAMNSPKYLQIFNTGGHYTFSVMCKFAPNLGDGCGEGFIGGERAYNLINLYALAFMRYYLMDEQRDQYILSDEYAESIEEITLRSSR